MAGILSGAGRGGDVGGCGEEGDLSRLAAGGWAVNVK